MENIREVQNKIKKKIKPGLFAKGRPDIIFIVISIILASFGMIMLFSASASISLSESGDSFSYISKQIKASILGLVLCIVVSIIDYRILNNKVFRILSYLFVLSAPIIVYFFGYEANFAKRWIKIGGFSLQPSEFSKIFLIICLASYFSKITENGKLDKFISSVLIPIILVVVPSILIFKLENHFSSTIVMMFITLCIIFLAGVKLKELIILGGLGIVSGLYILKEKFLTGDAGFRSTRIKTFLDPWSDSSDTGYQITQSLMAIGSGGFFGRGIGQSIQKRKYLPYAQNDFIFAIIVEEIGLIGGIILILAFLSFILLTIRVAFRSRDLFGKLIAGGIAAFYLIQIFVNIAVAIGLIPVTGMSLPFFSSGGTSILVTYITIGFVISISRINNYTEEIIEKEKIIDK